jgi:hypothetical protein
MTGQGALVRWRADYGWAYGRVTGTAAPVVYVVDSTGHTHAIIDTAVEPWDRPTHPLWRA